jgi:UDP-N-acetylmuramate--alanine ligase
MKGIDQHTIAEGIRATGHPSAMSIEQVRDLAPLLRHHIGQGDMVICLGAGTSTEWAHALPQWLAADEPRRANA